MITASPSHVSAHRRVSFYRPVSGTAADVGQEKPNVFFFYKVGKEKE